jgi:hypothetical protein
MTVSELIEQLKRLPQDAQVRAWDGDADEYQPIKEAIFEDGATAVDLICEGAWTGSPEDLSQ